MAFEWKDKRDGVDDILADDINSIAHAVMENEKNIPREPAGVYKTDISLLELENETNGDNVVIKAKSVDLGMNGTAKFCVSGHIRFTTKGEYGVYTPTIKVDGKIIDSKEVGKDDYDVKLFAYEFDGDIAESIELIASGSDTNVEFVTLCKIEEKDGLMSAEQAKKLNSTEIFTAEEKTKLESIDKVYTQEESDLLLDAYSIVTKKTVDLTGDELEGKKDSDHLYLKSITKDNAIVFGEECEITGRWFGYVGVKGFGRGYVNCVLVAEIDIETDFDITKARVQGFTKAQGGSETPTLEVIGTPRNGKNYIIYPCSLANATEIKGFYFDAQIGNSPTVKMILRDVRVYKQISVFELPKDNTEVIKEWKHEPFQMGSGVVSSLDPYILIYVVDGYRRWQVASLTDAMTADVLLYKPNDGVFASKEEVKALDEKVTTVEGAVATKAEQTQVTALGTIVNAKGLTFMQYQKNEKIPLEKDCLYYLRCNTDTIYYYKNGTKLSQFTSGFGDGFVMMASNIFQGAHVNFFAAVAGFMDYSMKGNTITTLDTDEVYAMSSSDFVNVWKVKA